MQLKSENDKITQERLTKIASVKDGKLDVCIQIDVPDLDDVIYCGNNTEDFGEISADRIWLDRSGKWFEIAFLIIKMTFIGIANSKNLKQGDGVLNLIESRGKKESNIVSYDAVGGPWGNGSPKNGEYTVHSLSDRGKTGWYNAGMTKYGVGFSLIVEPKFKTGRTELRIHPDGGDFFGTQGCIGLLGNKDVLLQFEKNTKNILSKQKNIALTINILNNPNDHGYGKKNTSNGE